MTAAGTSEDDDADGHLMEGVARVVAVRDGVPWLEPEPGTSCSGCVSLAMCGTKGGGFDALGARRFPLTGAPALEMGDRVVVGMPEGTVLRAAATAYGLPLLLTVAGGLAALGFGAGDLGGALAMGGGLGAGLLLGRIIAGRDEFSPRFLRRAPAGGDCAPPRN